VFVAAAAVDLEIAFVDLYFIHSKSSKALSPSNIRDNNRTYKNDDGDTT
jgi:hypothetical protein